MKEIVERASVDFRGVVLLALREFVVKSPNMPPKAYTHHVLKVLLPMAMSYDNGELDKKVGSVFVRKDKYYANLLKRVSPSGPPNDKQKHSCNDQAEYWAATQVWTVINMYLRKELEG